MKDHRTRASMLGASTILCRNHDGACGVNRSNRLGRPHFCSLKCAGVANFKNIPPDKLNRDTSRLRADNQRDKYTPFRQHLRSARLRSKERGEPVAVDLEYLQKLWDSQDGTCPFTGWKMLFNRTERAVPRTASLDRIDSTKGYIPGNLRFVCVMANLARNRFSDEELKEFCRAVAGKHPV